MPSPKVSDFTLTSEGSLRLYSTNELLRMPPPSWLVDGIMPARGIVSIYGPSGAGKSFIAIDLALCISCGVPWHGKKVKPGLVVYISAEGTAGLGRRASAWLRGHKLDAGDVNVAWLTQAVPIYAESADLERLFERVDELKDIPSCIIIDTMARCFEGDENETEDMGNFVRGIDRIRDELGSTVIAIHHTNASEGRERGNGAFRAAADTMICTMPGIIGQTGRSIYRAPQGSFTVICNKQKEAEPFPLGLGRLIPSPEDKSCRIGIEWMSKQETEEVL